MERLSKKSALDEAVKRLKELLGKSVSIKSEKPLIKDGRTFRPDAVVTAGGFRFVLEFKHVYKIGVVVDAIKQLRKYENVVDDAIPLVVVPYMDQAGINQCALAGMSWIDLSGNADVKGPGLRLYVRGEKNKFKKPGRKENPFSPKSSRLARRLLYRPEEHLTQRELTESTGLSEGLVSRVVKAMEKQHLVSRDENNRLFAADLGLLLDAWAQGYDFSKHELVRGHIAARSGQEVQHKLHVALSNSSVEYAATGLGAAWLCSHFAGFRISSFYLREWPDEQVLDSIGFREVEKGENIWLILPKDEDVFFGVEPVEDIPCIHPMQVWLDLKSHRERSEEAAEELRHQLNF